MLDVVLLDDLVIDRKHGTARISEHMLDPLVPECLKHHFGAGHLALHRSCPHCRGLAASNLHQSSPHGPVSHHGRSIAHPVVRAIKKAPEEALRALSCLGKRVLPRPGRARPAYKNEPRCSWSRQIRPVRSYRFARHSSLARDQPPACVSRSAKRLMPEPLDPVAAQTRRGSGEGQAQCQEISRAARTACRILQDRGSPATAPWKFRRPPRHTGKRRRTACARPRAARISPAGQRRIACPDKLSAKTACMRRVTFVYTRLTTAGAPRFPPQGHFEIGHVPSRTSFGQNGLWVYSSVGRAADS